MRDFRIIMNFEREWKQAEEQIQEAKSKLPGGGGSKGGLGIEDALNQHLEDIGEDGYF